MGSAEDLQFGKIALSKGFCTQAQIDECLRVQALSDEAPSLGELLLYKSYLTPEQHALVEKEQKGEAPRRESSTAKREESILFGKLAIQERVASPQAVEECLRERSDSGETRSLGEIMVAKGYLTQDQVKHLLARQQKKIMSCPACRLSFTVHTRSPGKMIACPRCKGTLQEGKPSASVRTDAEFATTILRMDRAGPPGSGKAPGGGPRPAPRVQVSCVVCDHPFQAAVDENGRVRCPSCNSTFSPRS